ncbi:MAG: TonB family protein [Flavobacteriales bacterium]|nr:TonB family protein [Flavobacteriales bacterium]
MSLMIAVWSVSMCMAQETDSASVDTAVYVIVEEMPRFPGCEEDENMSGAERQQCAFMEMQKYIMKNMTYPVEAMDECVFGTVHISFVVNEDGSISDVAVARSGGMFIDQEALRLVKNMPRWIPGYQKGEPVKVSYILPLRFSLKGGSDCSTPKKLLKAGVDARKKGRFDVAIRQIERVIKEVPESGVAYYELGITYSKMKQDDKACEAYSKGEALGNKECTMMLKEQCGGE